MARLSRRRVITLAVTGAVVLGVGGVALPALAEGSGSITGHYTDAGAPVAGAWVSLYDTNYTWIGGTYADAAGGFTFGNVPTGGYKIEFNANGGSQWAYQKSYFFEADVITVVDGQTTAVEESMRPHGSITGHVTLTGGAPAAGVQVTAQPSGPGSSASATTDENGYYAFNTMLVGDYRMQFSTGWPAPAQYAHGKTSWSSADVFTVVEGGATTVDEEMLEIGSVMGVLTDSDGAPVPYANVGAVSVATGEQLAWTTTDESGHYSLQTFTGDYKLSFGTQWGGQWATGRSSEAEADTITVVAEPITEHNETLVPLGTVEFTAVDSVTGEPVAQFCVNTSSSSDCTETGTLSYLRLPGTFEVVHYDPNGEYMYGTAVASATSGATTSVVLHLVPAASVTATITDRVTGAPVENACVELVALTEPNWLGANNGQCTDASGTVTLTLVDPDKYKVFVWAHDGIHGHQWVGWTGGVGRFELGRTVVVGAGQDVTLSGVKLDAAGGNIEGTMTDESTGAPIVYGTAGLSSFNFGYGGQEGLVGTDENGHFTMTGLGPYRWVLYFFANGYASEWSGDAATRLLARPVQVPPGATVTYQVEMGQGTTVTGTVTGPSGAAASDGRITFYNATTGDEIAVDDLYNEAIPGQYATRIRGVQRVKIAYSVTVNGIRYEGWVGGESFADADAFIIRPDGTQTINFVATTVWQGGGGGAG